MIGRTIAHFQITAKLGEGGMGEVYLAEDGRLGRKVAIKVLPKKVAEDADRLARFRREAQLLAALNHPHVATIYEVGTSELPAELGSEGTSETLHYLVIELVEGEDLSTRLRRGPMPLGEALEIARQICQALEAAHRKGIIHRDLKPGNVKLTAGGEAKVLDFGLAKALGPGDESTYSAELDHSPTLTFQATAAGFLLGTAAYMSPEQARGEAVDERADIWAFGVVLWEMLTGRKLFEDRTASDTLASVLRQEIDLDALPHTTPAPLKRLLRRCLEREKTSRLHNIADARLEIEEAIASPEAEPRAEAEKPTRTYAIVAAVGLVIGLALGAQFWRGEERPGPTRERSSFRTATEPLSIPPVATTPILALSDDGRHLVYPVGEGKGSLSHRPLDQLEGRPIPGSEGAIFPAFSPDGRHLVFHRDRKLQRLPLEGGSAIVLREGVTVFMPGLDWGEDGFIYYSDFRNVLRIPENGGPPQHLRIADDGEAVASWVDGPGPDFPEKPLIYPSLSPDGRFLLFTEMNEEEMVEGSGDLWMMSLGDGSCRRLLSGFSYSVVTSSGHILTASSDGTLLAAPLDLSTRTVLGDPIPILQGIQTYSHNYPGAHFAIARDGTLAFLPFHPDALESRLYWLDRDGRLEPLLDRAAAYGSPRLSPEGDRVAFTESPADGSRFHTNVWVLDIERQVRTQLSFVSRSSMTAWSPDGRTVAFTQPTPLGGWRNGGVFAVASDGSEDPVRLSRGEFHWVHDWSPDGSRLLLSTALGDERFWDLATYPADGNGDPEPLLPTSAPRGEGRFSPDGRWVAFNRYQGGQSRVVIATYPEPNHTMQLSSEGGRDPAWSADGRSVFYRRDNVIFRVRLDLDGEPSAGAPEIWVDIDLGESHRLSAFDVAKDGRMAILAQDTREVERREIHVVLGFHQDLLKRAPIP